MEIIASKKVKTRKPHHCWGCRKECPTGINLERTTSKDGGQITNVYWCDDCQKYLNSLPMDDYPDGYEYGQIADMKAGNY